MLSAFRCFRLSIQCKMITKGVVIKKRGLEENDNGNDKEQPGQRVA